MAGQLYIPVHTGISTAIIEATRELEKHFEANQVFAEKERLIMDRQWLRNILQRNPGIQYLRVVKTKPEGGKFIKRRFYFDAFVVKRYLPGKYEMRWMLYLVILSK